MKRIKIKELELGTGRPKICVPLTGRTKTGLIEEAVNAKTSCADLVEWRIDWFDLVDDIEELSKTSMLLREILGSIPLLITFRTEEEGGAKPIEKEAYEALLMEICERQLADLIDIESMKGDELVRRLVRKAKEQGIFTVGSNHDFDKTPSKEEIVGRLCKMQDLNFDITKIAVMPKKERDVLTLLDATLSMKEIYADRPFITMSMDKMGLISRMAGELFGSCLTFGKAGEASAPGQIDAGELCSILDLLHEVGES